MTLCNVLARLVAVLILIPSSALAQGGPVGGPAANNEIQPPFGLIWHEPSERLEGKIDAAKLNILERRKIGRLWTIVVNGFKKPNPGDAQAPKPPELRQALFYFAGGQISKDKGKDGKIHEHLVGGQLIELELQYEQKGWGEDEYSASLSEKRQMLERIYGQGQQLVRSTAPTPDGKASQTMVGYKWNKNNTAVELIYFSVSSKETEQKFYTLSVHYKRS